MITRHKDHNNIYNIYAWVSQHSWDQQTAISSSNSHQFEPSNLLREDEHTETENYAKHKLDFVTVCFNRSRELSK